MGKTTVLERACKKYYTLDQKPELDFARAEPDKYLRERSDHWVALDECQTAPELFPALKDFVRTHKRPGQFLLSGSVRFTSRKAIRESLTGRIISLELYPFTIDELDGRPLSSQCKSALENATLESLASGSSLSAVDFRRKSALMETYFKQGGLPGVCFVRNDRLRHLKIDEQLRTILDRDLRMIQKTTLPYQDLRQLCAVIAGSQGRPVDYTQMRKESGISVPTLKKLLYAAGSGFLDPIVAY